MTRYAIEDPYPEIPPDAPAPNPKLAVCKVERIPSRVFFIDNERNYPKLVSDAKAFCARCPEREVCLVYAFDRDLTHGIYGGRTASERSRMKRKHEAIKNRQFLWKQELKHVNWDRVAYSIGLPRGWRTKYDSPEHMIDSDSIYFRTGDGMLGCSHKRNGCAARFETLMECFIHAHDPKSDHRRSDAKGD